MPALLASALTGAALSAEEVQWHGLIFEKWVCDTFFDGYKPASYPQRWDVPAAENKNHGRVPVNPKSVKYGRPIGRESLHADVEDEKHPAVFGSAHPVESEDGQPCLARDHAMIVLAAGLMGLVNWLVVWRGGPAPASSTTPTR